MQWRIGEVLVQKKLITWDQLETALAEQQITQSLTGDILIKRGFISETLLYKVLAEQFQVRFIDLSKIRLSEDLTKRIPVSIAMKYRVLPLSAQGSVISFATDTPIQSWPLQEMMGMTDFTDIRMVICTPTQLSEFLEKIYREELDCQI